MIGSVAVNVEVSPLWIMRIVCAWTADANGVAEIELRELPHGVVLNRLVTVPSASSPPTAGYDVMMLTENSVDMLGGAGANRSAMVVETVGIQYVLPGAYRYSPVVTMPARLMIENAGAGGGGVMAGYLINLRNVRSVRIDCVSNGHD